MVLVFASIPLMILAVAIATVPILIAMRQEAIEQRRALAHGVTPRLEESRPDLRQAA